MCRPDKPRLAAFLRSWATGFLLLCSLLQKKKKTAAAARRLACCLLFFLVYPLTDPSPLFPAVFSET